MAKDWMKEGIRLLKKGFVFQLLALIAFGILGAVGLILPNLNEIIQQVAQNPAVLVTGAVGAILIGLLLEKTHAFIRN